MKRIGAIVLSYEEAGDLAGLIPWKVEDPVALLQTLKERSLPVEGFLYLSTCNRVEIIYTLENPDLHEELYRTLVEIMPPLRSDLSPALYHGHRALRHLLRLTSGLESMVLGETEIRSQVKDAFEDARLNNILDKRLRILLQNIFHESRQIRNSIPMNNLPLSVATLAAKSLTLYPGFVPRVDESQKPEAGSIVVIGSGPMSRQAAEYLTRWNHPLVLVNRTLEKVISIAERVDGKALEFDSFMENPGQIGPISAIVTATSRNDAFLTRDFIRQIKEHNGTSLQSPLVLVDMALPPDVEPEAALEPGVELISMETMREELEQNRQKRVLAAGLAEGYVEDAIYRVEANLIAGLSGSIMKEIQKDVKNKSREQLLRLLEDRLSHLSKKDRNIIYTWAIQSHRELNRIHKKGLESVIRNYFAEERKNADMPRASVSGES